MNDQTRSRLSGFTRVYIGFGAALVILAGMDLGGLATAHLLKDRVKWQTHTYEVLDRTTDLAGSIRAVEAAHRGYVASGDEHFIKEYRSTIDSVRHIAADLDSLTSDNTDQTARLGRLGLLIASRRAWMDSANSLRANGDIAAATDIMRSGSQSVVRRNVFGTINEVGDAERSLLAHRNERLSETLFAVKWITIIGLAFSAFLIIVSLLLIRIEIKRRRSANRALAASEERLRDFLESASDLIQSSSADGRLMYANRALLDTLGYRANEVIGQPSEMLFAPEEVEKGRAWFDRLLAGEALTDIDTVYLRKDGRRVHVTGSSNCRFEDGRPVATRTILHDVTRQREVDSMKDQFVSIVSHELRTPLTSIRGALGLLAGGMLGDVSDRGQRMLNVAIANTDRLVRLINDILDVERIESGAVPMSRRRVSLNEILNQVDELMQPLAHKAGISLLIGRLDVDLNADADRIVQTLTNLVSNSIKFSPPDTTIRVEAEREVEHVHIRVCDEGRGIPADMLETIFARFQQVDASDNREKGGSGLGLAISRSIIEQHEGRIWAAGQLDEGAIFHILLPIMPPPRSTVDLGTEIADGDAHAVARGDAGADVLVVEDDVDLARILVEFLRRHGLRPLHARDGREAVQMSQKAQPALIILDLVLPDTDGFAVVDWLKQHDRLCDVPIMVYTARDLDEEQRARLDIAPELLFTKSRVPPGDFVERIAALVSHLTQDHDEAQI